MWELQTVLQANISTPRLCLFTEKYKERDSGQGKGLFALNFVLNHIFKTSVDNLSIHLTLQYMFRLLVLDVSADRV